MGRATQGVRLINLGKRSDEIASVCKVESETENEDDENIIITENEINNDTDNTEIIE